MTYGSLMVQLSWQTVGHATAPLEARRTPIPIPPIRELTVSHAGNHPLSSDKIPFGFSVPATTNSLHIDTGFCLLPVLW